MLTKRKHCADLDGFMTPGDGPGANPTMAVIDERTLIEDSQIEHLPIELDGELLGDTRRQRHDLETPCLE
ncbi:hypothetical protein [Myxococcus stipitatus]|uniref:hypothetical protein n=1 Tax=Myxococcus stipitatus TaxID=83455 RepID=UPI001E567C48|nr:hypothetical protein [Myxococcus stipitatus]